MTNIDEANNPGRWAKKKTRMHAEQWQTGNTKPKVIGIFDFMK
jgi:hypothetical protein